MARASCLLCCVVCVLILLLGLLHSFSRKSLLLSSLLSSFHAPSNPERKSVRFERVLVEDGKVRDCITGEQKGTGVAGAVRTVDLALPGAGASGGAPGRMTGGEGAQDGGPGGENRNASIASFQRIFQDRTWVNGDKGSKAASGRGARIDYAVEAMAGLNSLMTELRLRLGAARLRLLDIPCGDMQWMRRLLEARDDVEYTGVDIVPELIAQHRKDYADRPWRFEHRDVIKDGLKDNFDLVFSRHMLQHLFTTDVIAFLAQVSRSGSRYLLTTSFPRESRNVDLDLAHSGRFRRLNLEAPPVALAPPLCYLKDGPPEDPNHILALYRLPLRRVEGCEGAAPRLMARPGQDLVYHACGNWSV